MYSKICNFDVEAQAYIDAYCNSNTLNELIALLDESSVWRNRRERLGNSYSAGWYEWRTNEETGRRKKVYLTNIEGNPNQYSTWQMARYMHKALQKKGVLLPPWTDRKYHCIDSRMPLVNRLNARLALA